VAIINLLDLYDVECKRTAFDALIVCFGISLDIQIEKDKKEDG